MAIEVGKTGKDNLPENISRVDTAPGNYVQEYVVAGDGTLEVEWVDVASFGVGAASIYTASGTLEEDRTVTGDGNDLIFTGNPLFAVRSTSGIDLDGAVVINESSASVDFRVEGATDANLIFADGSADSVGIGTATPAFNLDVAGTFGVTGGSTLEGATVINEAGASVDTRIEGDTNVNLVFVDASTDRVGIGTATPSVLFDVNGAANVTGAFTTVAAVTMNDAGADIDVRIESADDANALTVDGALNAVGIGVAPAAHIGKLDVSQNSATGALPVIAIQQVDVSEEFLRFVGTSAATNANSFADAADLATPGAIVGWLKIYVQDDAGAGGIVDGLYWIPFYATPTA